MVFNAARTTCIDLFLSTFGPEFMIGTCAPEGDTSRTPLEKYNEMSVELLQEECAEHGIEWNASNRVGREYYSMADGRNLSALRWGQAKPELLLLHGGAQHAHAWDAVALALGCPLLALDLPSHGHSDAAKDGVHDPSSLAEDIAAVLDQAACSAMMVCGASLGGLASISLASLRPDLVRRLVLVDVTPDIVNKKAPRSAEFQCECQALPTFGELLLRMCQRHPTLSESSLRRMLMHSLVVSPEDGLCRWRHERHPRRHPRRSAFAKLWGQLDSIDVPVMLVRGTTPASLVDDADAEELRQRVPMARIEYAQGGGHRLHIEQPAALAAMLESFIDPDTECEHRHDVEADFARPECMSD